MQELGGLLWTYLGPAPVPLLPRWDLLVWDNVTREISAAVLPCNWLQCVDNGLDQTHVEHLHGNYGLYAARLRGGEEEVKKWLSLQVAHRDKHLKLGFDRFEYGVIKRRVTIATEGTDHWTTGHPMVLPGMLLWVVWGPVAITCS